MCTLSLLFFIYRAITHNGENAFSFYYVNSSFYPCCSSVNLILLNFKTAPGLPFRNFNYESWKIIYLPTNKYTYTTVTWRTRLIALWSLVIIYGTLPFLWLTKSYYDLYQYYPYTSFKCTINEFARNTYFCSQYYNHSLTVHQSVKFLYNILAGVHIIYTIQCTSSLV